MVKVSEGPPKPHDRVGLRFLSASLYLTVGWSVGAAVARGPEPFRGKGSDPRCKGLPLSSAYTAVSFENISVSLPHLFLPAQATGGKSGTDLSKFVLDPRRESNTETLPARQ